MGIKRAILRHWSRKPAAAPPKVRWQHRKWPARSIDRFVVSFPKSGRTWLRVLLGAAEAHRHGATVEAEVAQWLAQEVPTLDGRPVLFTHALSEEASEPARHMDLFQQYVGDRRRLFLVRDPRDVVVSYFFQRVKREDRPGDLPTELSAFVRDPRYGIDRICTFLAACERGRTEEPGPALLLSYEDLHADAVGSLARVLAFFGVGDTPRAVVEAAVEYGRFENMRKLEVTNTLQKQNNRLRALDPDDPDTFKTRKGRVGSYAEHLRPEDVAHVEERIAALLPPSLGYARPGEGPAGDRA